MKLNKQFKYKNYNFNTSVELNTMTERRIGGKVWHTIITNCTDGSNYYLKEDIETFEIEEAVKKHEQLATESVDKLTHRNKSFEENLLNGMGFE